MKSLKIGLLIGLLFVLCVFFACSMSPNASGGDTWEAGDVAYFVLKEVNSNKCVIGSLYINKVSGEVANITDLDKDGNKKSEPHNVSISHLNRTCVKWYAEALKQKAICEGK